MNRFLQRCAEQIYRFLPKFNYAVVWGWPDYEDSVIALEEGLQDSSVRTVVLLMTDVDTTPVRNLGSKTKRVRKNSLLGYIWFCFAKYVFFTHPCFTRNFPKNVVSVNIWHGMPIKKIGWMIDDDPGTSARFTMATSPFWGEIMDRAMKPYGEVLSLGLPRNDRLFSNKKNVASKLGLEGNEGIAVWLPTYRKSVRGHSRSDGVTAGNVFEMPGIDPDRLDSFLKSKNLVMIVKPHPMAFTGKPEIRSNLLMIDDSWLKMQQLSLYEVLGAADFLISDISSVVIDFLLLDRPVIHAFSDFAEYKESRGFTVEPIEDFLAGPVVSNSEELESAISHIHEGGDPMAKKRKNLLQLSHSFPDGRSTERILDAVGLRLPSC